MAPLAPSRRHLQNGLGIESALDREVNVDAARRKAELDEVQSHAVVLLMFEAAGAVGNAFCKECIWFCSETVLSCAVHGGLPKALSL